MFTMKKLLFSIFLLWSLSAHAAMTIVICGGVNHQCANNPNIPPQDSGAASDLNATGLTAGSAVAQSNAPAVNVPGASIGSLPPSGAPAAPLDPTLPVSPTNPLCSTSGNQIICDGGVGPAFTGGGTVIAPSSSYFYDPNGNVSGHFSTAAAICAAEGARVGRPATVAVSPSLCSDGSGYFSVAIASANSCPSGTAYNASTQDCSGTSAAVPAGMTETQTPAQPATSSSPAVPATNAYSGTPSVIEQFVITGANPSGAPGTITPGTAAAASGTPSGSGSGTGSGTCPPGAICNTAGLAQDASVQTLIKKVEDQSVARANDVAAAGTAAAGFPSQNNPLDASKVGLPSSSTFSAPVFSLDGLLPSSTTCVPIPTTILGHPTSLDPCRIVTIAMPFINWAIITIAVIGGIGLILNHPKSEG